MIISLTAAFALLTAPASNDNAGPLVAPLWLIQCYGTAEATDTASDQRVKGVLFKALGKEGELTSTELKGLMDADTFKSLAGGDDRLDQTETRLALEADMPESRKRLLPKIREHAEFLTTSFDMIDEPHRLAGQRLAEWIAKSHQPGQKLHVTVICTGNSRRSILGATMGNVAASFYGLPEVCFHSGGTAPTAFNSRTVTALREVGLEINAVGEEAERSEPKTANPIYRVRWGTPDGSEGMAFEALEFSKKLDAPTNPQEGFAALMVCGEADASCPFVKGAAVRISMPYLDPKIYDDSSYEAAKYGERRDDMGRLMLATMMQARQRIAATTRQEKVR